MADAKSRYEIVESLTNQRQQVIDEITRLKNSKTSLDFKIEQLGRNQAREIESITREHKQVLEDTKAKFTSDKKASDQSIEDLGKKQVALKEAIDALKSISSNNEKA